MFSFTAIAAAVFTATIAAWPTNIVFVSVSVAFHAIVEVADAFFDVFLANFLWGVFMTAITGVATIVVSDVTRHALHVVITVKLKIFLVIKSGRQPFVLAVTLATVTGDFLVQTVFGCLVTTLAFCAGRFFQQLMVEVARGAKPFYASMIAMTRNTVVANELLVKWGGCQRLFNWQAHRCQFANFLWFVAGHAFF